MYIFKENYKIDNVANKHTHEEDEIIFTTEITHTFIKRMSIGTERKLKRHILGILNAKM